MKKTRSRKSRDTVPLTEVGGKHTREVRARIFKLFVSQRIDSIESILPAYVAWRAGTTTLFLVLSRFLAPIDCLKFQHCVHTLTGFS
jgi:hypothetical protein